MASKVWGQGEAEPEAEKEPEAVADSPVLEAAKPAIARVVNKLAAEFAHVHEWTQISTRKRKCKACGAVEVSE